MRKGSMTLIDEATAERLYADLPAGQETSGGSVANTCAVAAALGARVAFLGMVADDQLGRGVPPRHRRRRGALPDPAARWRRPHRALPDRGDAGRPAHHEHLSSAPASPSAPTRSTRRWRRVGGHLSRGLSVRSAGRPGRLPPRRRGRPRGRAAGGAVAVGRLLRRSPPGRLPRPGGRACRYPVRQRDGNLRACTSARLRRGGRARAPGRGAGGADPQRGRQRVLRRAETIECRPSRRPWSTRPAPATPMPPGSWPADRGRPAACGRLGSIAAAEVIAHYGARPQRNLAGVMASLQD